MQTRLFLLISDYLGCQFFQIHLTNINKPFVLNQKRMPWNIWVTDIPLLNDNNLVVLGEQIYLVNVLNVHHPVYSLWSTNSSNSSILYYEHIVYWCWNSTYGVNTLAWIPAPQRSQHLISAMSSDKLYYGLSFQKYFSLYSSDRMQQIQASQYSVTFVASEFPTMISFQSTGREVQGKILPTEQVTGDEKVIKLTFTVSYMTKSYVFIHVITVVPALEPIIQGSRLFILTQQSFILIKIQIVSLDYRDHIVFH